MSSWGNARLSIKRGEEGYRLETLLPNSYAKLKAVSPWIKIKDNQRPGKTSERYHPQVESAEHPGHTLDTLKGGMITFEPATLKCLLIYQVAAPWSPYPNSELWDGGMQLAACCGMGPPSYELHWKFSF